MLFEQRLKHDYLPLLRSTPTVDEVKIFKLLTEVENGGNTVSLQLFFDSMENFMAFELNKKDDFIALVEKQFKGNYVYFHTLLEQF